jgi:hypothetical protein
MTEYITKEEAEKIVFFQKFFDAADLFYALKGDSK